jgi:hypothetical protein
VYYHRIEIVVDSIVATVLAIYARPVGPILFRRIAAEVDCQKKTVRSPSLMG